MNKKEVGEGVPANTEMSQAGSCFSEASWKFSPGTAQESNAMRTSSRSSSQTHLKLKSKSWLCRLWCWQQPQPALTHTQSRIFKCPLGSLSGTTKQGQLLPSLDEDQTFQLFFTPGRYWRLCCKSWGPEDFTFWIKSRPVYQIFHPGNFACPWWQGLCQVTGHPLPEEGPSVTWPCSGQALGWGFFPFSLQLPIVSTSTCCQLHQSVPISNMLYRHLRFCSVG